MDRAADHITDNNIGNLTNNIAPNNGIKRGDQATYTSKDIIFALAMLVIGFLYWNLIRLPNLGAGVTLFAAVFCLSTFIYLKSAGVRQTKRSIIALSIVTLSALVFVLFDNPLIKGLNFIFVIAGVIYWISLYTGRTLEKKISAYIIGDFYQQVFVIPFGNFMSCFDALRKPIASNQKGKSLLAGLIGILVMLPVLVAVINLLMEADAAFSNVMANLHFTFSIDILFQVILGIPVACYLFGLVYGDLHGKNTGTITVETVDKAASAFRFAPEMTVYSALTALNLVFVVFFLSQFSYLFSAFQNQLPELMTYAEYARRGFFELCTVAGINLVVITAAHLFAKRGKGRILQIETIALCLFTLLLIITAISKMVMYINSYGLTQLRVYTTWFMVVLFFVFAVTAIRQFKVFNATRVMLTGFVILFLALSYGNVDGRIAAYNIDRYQNGTLETLDVPDLSRLSDAAIPYMYELYQNTDNHSMKMQLEAALKYKTENMIPYRSTFRNFNLQSYAAENVREMF